MTQSEPGPDFAALLGEVQRSAVHLEMRDLYSVGDESGIITDSPRPS